MNEAVSMDIDTHIARVKSLIAKREEIDAVLSEIFGITIKTRKTLRCSRCGEEGHNAKTCPTLVHAARSPQPHSPARPTPTVQSTRPPSRKDRGRKEPAVSGGFGSQVTNAQ